MKPKSLDSVQITSLNTRIACSGIDGAEQGYRDWCREAGVAVEGWVINYLRLYRKYFKRKTYEGSGFIDVKAAQRALEEA